jgi:eukaryotic-like serine/threonine-protein kinase
MSLSPGQRLGPYEVLSPIGAGGIGEVYKARDTRLDRPVAIKVLPEHIAKREELRVRFEREARAVASLNHPQICVLHDIGEQDGTRFMVMELIEGETLAARIGKGAVPLRQALTYSTQIADALDRAHRAGVTHRDIKPGNIMVTRDGVKVLDFGLAKATAVPAAATESTLTKGLTGEGTVLGTPQYMAPEQFEGREADARSDIWAFGAVVYELATGEKAFQGKSYTSLVGAILSAPPKPMSLKPFTPPALERLVLRCLAKDPEDRYQSMRDVVLDLHSIAEGPGEMTAAALPRRRWVWPGIAGVLALTTAGGWMVRPPRLADPVPGIFDLQPAAAGTTIVAVSVSPDGDSVIWRGMVAGTDKIYLRTLSSGVTRVILHEAGGPQAWSPDGRSIAYFSGGKLKRQDLTGGTAQTICDWNSGAGVAWGKDGILLGDRQGPLSRVGVGGGTPAPIFKLDAERGETGQSFPALLPDGRLLYQSEGRSPDVSGIYITSSDGGGKPRRVHPSTGGAFKYIHPGRILVRHGDSVAIVRVDLDGNSPPGEPVLLHEKIAGMHRVGASNDGRVIALWGGTNSQTDLCLLDRSGRKLAVILPGTTGEAGHPAFSPDGKRVAFDSWRTGSINIWVYDLARQATTRLTFTAGFDVTPAWSASGDRVYYSSTRAATGSGIYGIGSNGVVGERLVAAVEAHHSHATPDGQMLAFERTTGAIGGDLWRVSLDGQGKMESLLTGQPYMHPHISPDSRLIAYSSPETGRHEVYVQTMPPGGGKWQVSTAGGREPKWRNDGQELYFLEGHRVMAATIHTRGAAVEVGEIKELFQARGGVGGDGHFAASPDGKLFVLNLANDSGAARPMTLLLNWKLP